VKSATSILPVAALAGARVAVSVSESSDLSRLGVAETHLRIALGELARSVLSMGGGLAYGGHFAPSGYTVFLASEIGRTSRRDQPLTVCLSCSEHRRKSLADLREVQAALGMHGTLTCLDIAGNPVDPASGRDDEPPPPLDAGEVVRSLTSMRIYMTSISAARVLIGGKRQGYQGRFPGIIEEALLALAAGRPLYVAAGFGGAALDVARVMDSRVDDWIPAWPATLEGSAPPAGIPEFRELLASGASERSPNGLDEHENCRLMVTHRPSEIAALVATGLGRLLADRKR